MAVNSSSDLANIRTQVEFYFGLDNLMQDAFLLCRMNSRMMVPLSLIFSFKKIRQLSSSFDAVLAAVKESPSKLVVEFDNDVWWIGPNPQACRGFPCTIVLMDVAENITVEHIEALTTVPLLHSFTFANGYWYATYQDRNATEMALAEMQNKKLGSLPVKARLRSELPVDFDPSRHSLSSRPSPAHRAPRVDGTHSQRGPGACTRLASVAGCPLFVSRNPMSAQRSQVSNGVTNALMSTFYSLPPVQQQVVMMNCMMAQQQLLALNGSRMDDTVAPYFGQWGPVKGHQRSTRPRQGESAKSRNIAPIDDGIEAIHSPSRAPHTGRGKVPPAPTGARMEALGADLPDVKLTVEAEGAAERSEASKDAFSSTGTPNAIVKKNTKLRKSDRRVPSQTASSVLPSLDPTNYPTLGQEVPSVQKQPALSGWAAIIAKAPSTKAQKNDEATA